MNNIISVTVYRIFLVIEYCRTNASYNLYCGKNQNKFAERRTYFGEGNGFMTAFTHYLFKYDELEFLRGRYFAFPFILHE